MKSYAVSCYLLILHNFNIIPCVTYQYLLLALMFPSYVKDLSATKTPLMIQMAFWAPWFCHIARFYPIHPSSRFPNNVHSVSFIYRGFPYTADLSYELCVIFFSCLKGSLSTYKKTHKIHPELSWGVTYLVSCHSAWNWFRRRARFVIHLSGNDFHTVWITGGFCDNITIDHKSIIDFKRLESYKWNFET